MSAQDNGGPAFPIPGAHMPNGEWMWGDNGMTLRDYFAVHASRQDVEAQAEVLRAQLHKKNGIAILPDGWPVTARYMHADAMLEARK